MIKILAPALGGALMIGAAHAEPVGTVSSVEGDVFAIRGNDSVALTAGDSVLLNDRIVARADAAASVDAFGCTSAVAEGTIVMVNDGMCASSPVSFGFAQGTEGVPSILITGAMLAAPAIIAYAISESDDDDERNEVPVSP